MTEHPVLIHLGDCRDILAELEDASVDSIVTDPPYELGFMGKKWDGSGIAFDVEMWEQCLRVLKPGGHLLAFGGSRTWHRLTVAIEDAGFEIRDSIAWLYGSGFPKSLDVSKAIDKAGGESPQRQAEVLRNARTRAGLSRGEVAERIGCTPSSVRDWEEGRSRAVGRSLEWITPSPEYRDRLADLLGYTSDERRITGASTDRRGDGTVIGLGHSGVKYGTDASTEAAKQWQGWGTALKPAFEPIVVARKPLAGTVAANVLEHGTGALNIDACRIPAGQDYRDKCASVVGLDSNRNGAAYGEWTGARTDSAREEGRWPTNVVLDDTQAAELDAQTGIQKSGTAVQRNGGGQKIFGGIAGGENSAGARPDAGYNDEGGASRFFPVFKYQAKAPTKERPSYVNEDGNKVAHSTVKPLALMRWLVKLVTPPGGVVLDPFAGSGTTVEACLLEKFRCIAIENEPDYIPLIEQRLERSTSE
ncbi:DNA methylase [Mycobacterium phage HanKaySha]|nr:DNA methylase [Mycobacterium phage HanKaySha]